MNRIRKLINNAFVLFVCSAGAATAAPDSCEQKQDDGSFKLVPRIVNGHQIDITQAPWQVALLSPSGHQFCGGSFLSPTWVLTAAHCISSTSPSEYIVGYGKTNKGDLEKVSVKRVFKHPKYRDATKGYDIALLQLSKSVDTASRSVQTINMPSDKLERELMDEQKCASVTGWGTTRYQGNDSAIL
jgi:secreted trypsin-like serine protease